MCRWAITWSWATAATLGGHVTVGDWAVISAYSGVHQFCRIGRHAIIGGYSVITQDVLPFSNTVSERAHRRCSARIDRDGAARVRDGIDRELHTAFRLLTRGQLNTTQAIERIRAEVPPCAEVDELLAFIRSAERGFIK